MTLEDYLSKVRHKGMAVRASFSYSKVKYTTQCSALLWKTTAVSPKRGICGTKKHLLQDQLIQKAKYGLMWGHISPSTSQHCFCNQNDSRTEELQTSLLSLKWQPWAMFSKHCSSCQWNGGGSILHKAYSKVSKHHFFSLNKRKSAWGKCQVFTISWFYLFILAAQGKYHSFPLSLSGSCSDSGFPIHLHSPAQISTWSNHSPSGLITQC